MLKPINFYEKLSSEKDESDNPYLKEHGIEIPFRMTVIGTSGSMKTNTALDILSKFKETFHHVTVVTRNIDEPLYNLLQEKLPKESLTVVEVEGDDLEGLPELGEDTTKNPHTLIIFDDLVLVKNQRKICDFYIRARKFKISLMYLTQSYFGVPKTIRINSTIMIFKKVNSKTDLRYTMRDYSLSLTLDQLVKVYNYCTRNQLDWLMIKMDNSPPTDRFYLDYQRIDLKKTLGIDVEEGEEKFQEKDEEIKKKRSKEESEEKSEEEREEQEKKRPKKDEENSLSTTNYIRNILNKYKFK